MSFFKEFKKNYKKISKVASKLTPQNKPAKTTATVSSYDPKEDPDEFYYRFERTIDNWEERIDNTMEWDDNPNVTVKNYEKVLQKCDKFKEWCYSKGEVGEKYYAQEGKRFREDVQNAYDNYMANDYEGELAEWNKEQEEKREYERAIKKSRDIVLEAVKKEGKISQVELKNIYSSSEPEISFNSVIEYWQGKGKIQKIKEGSRVYFVLHEE